MSTYGGKADNLLQLQGSFSVPVFFVVAPDDDLDGVLKRFDELEAKTVAVRSSAVNEDSHGAAWAGQLETFLEVKRDDVLVAVKKCRASVTSERAKVYGNLRDIAAGTVAVIVQKMIDARVSGVAFSQHPVTGLPQVVTEAVHGLGDQLVSGAVTPDTYTEDGSKFHAGEVPVLTNVEILEVIQLCKNVAQFLGYPVDIEWAYEGDFLYLLQARPITTL